MEIKTLEDLNKKAEALKEVGDEEGLVQLAERFGLDKEDALDYMDGAVEEFATPLMAAVAKLKKEAKELSLKGVMKDWEESIESLCADDEELCVAVMKCESKLENCLAKLLKFAFDNKEQVHDSIVKAAGLRTPLYLGIPGKADLKKLVAEYYKG